ncbi:MAG: metallophosphoesterase [bacterium]|nr:metallophosphoesterase [bacterium]
MKIKKTLKYSVGIIILLFFIAYTQIILTARNLAPVPGLGNFPDNFQRLETIGNKDSYRFMVIGDTQFGIATAQNLFRQANKDSIDFGIYAGDLVARSTPGYYRVFLTEYSNWDVEFPVFVVPGNHDIADVPASVFGGRGKYDINGSGEKLFETSYGPLQNFFVFGQDLFVLLNNGKERDDLVGEDYQWLGKVLEENYKGKRYIFLFMHKPSAWAYGTGERRNDADPTFKTLHDLVKKYNVNYIFSGHIHNPRAENRDGHMYIVSGGGGGGLKFNNGFHHFMEINVTPEKISYNLIESSRKFSLYTEFERVVLSQINPLLFKNQ